MSSVGVIINNTKLIVNKDGDMWRILKSGKLKIIKNTINHIMGYNQISLGLMVYLRHRIIGYVYLGLDIDNPKQQIDHIDGVKTNNQLSNLRIVNNQQNQFNRKKVRGYNLTKSKKFKARITLNGKTISLGIFINEIDAKQSYLEAKLIYHIAKP